MSNFDDDFLKPRPKTKAPRQKTKPGKGFIWNVLTGVMLFLTAGACLFYISLIRNPYSRLNPFAPPTIVPPPATATWTPIGYASTWTPTVTLPPTDTATPRPTFTVVPSITPFKITTPTPNFTATKTPKPSRTPIPTVAPYSVSVSFNESTTFRPDTTCNSMYVAGQALDARNKPVIGLFVKLGGSLPGKTIYPVMTTLTGIDKVYGQSGFEFNLNMAPIASNKTLWVQLVDQTDTPLSAQYKLTTYADCKKNLILIRFQQK